MESLVIDYCPLYYHRPASPEAELADVLTCPNCTDTVYELREVEWRDEFGQWQELVGCDGCLTDKNQREAEAAREVEFWSGDVEF